MEKGEKREEDHLKIDLIKKGTVIDHIRGGWGLMVISILGIKSPTDREISIAVNVQSKRMKHKDIIKIEGRELDSVEVNKIAIIASRATINVIRDTKVVIKNRVKLPKVIEGIIKCQNPTCITNDTRPEEPSIRKEPVKTKFYPLNPEDEQTSFQCHYCRQILDHADAIKAII
jgi:aspartate carbamoyltransferase regulatory subunit